MLKNDCSATISQKYTMFSQRKVIKIKIHFDLGQYQCAEWWQFEATRCSLKIRDMYVLRTYKILWRRAIFHFSFFFNSQPTTNLHLRLHKIGSEPRSEVTK